MLPKRETLRAIDGLADPLGVLSIYVDVGEPGEPNALAAALLAGQRLRRLEASVAHNATDELAQALDQALAHVRPALVDMVTRPGRRGRAMFAGLSRDEIWEFDTAMPVRTTAVLEPTGYVRPLVAALDEGRPAGLALVRGRCLRLLEWHAGVVEEIGEPGVVRAGGKRASTVAVRIGDVARVRGWRRLLVAGDPQLAGELIGLDPPIPGCHVFVARRALAAIDGGSGEAVGFELAEAQRFCEMALVTRAMHAAEHGSEAVLGIEATASAFAAGRVAHLVFDEDRDYLRWPGGAIVEAGLRIDPAERLIELALDGAAEITPVEGRAARALDRADGVLALTRW
jgi:Bacterial archaeo-eukaryotic release factor family 10